MARSEIATFGGASLFPAAAGESPPGSGDSLGSIPVLLSMEAPFMPIYPVIMGGGAGTRLWPASRPSTPKQFIRLVGRTSTFEDTLGRLDGLPDVGAVVVVAAREHAAAVRAQLGPWADRTQILLEPCRRDSAAAMAAAAAWVRIHDPDGVLVVLAADHHVPDAPAFRDAIGRAVDVARQGWITTLGVRPTASASAYGYIRPGSALGAGRRVDAFVEKPDAARAAAFVDAGYLWNSGNFVAQARTLLEEIEASSPATTAAVEGAIRDGLSVDNHAFALGPAFADAPAISIDYAVMERTRRAAVLPVSFAWSDLGAWDAVQAAGPLDRQGNAVAGEAILIDAEQNLVRAADGMVVAAVGVRRLAIVAESDAVLVCDLGHSQDVKHVVEALRRQASPQVDRRSADADLPLSDWAARYDHWLRTAALPLWGALGVDHEQGGFHESLLMDAGPSRAARRARCQARQIFVYATAGASGWRGPWRILADQGLAYFTERYQRADGLFRTLVCHEGRPWDDTPVLYDQAFALLALAALHKSDPDRKDLAIRAARLMAAIETEFGAPGGGYREAGGRYLSNPHMHLLEAALAWAETGGGEPWDRLAADLVGLALGRFIDAEGGFLRENFNAAWRPLEGPPGRAVEPGHQFEWAWLLDRWAERSGDAAAYDAARRLYAFGARHIDPVRNVAVDELNERGEIVRATARLWPQTERLKAALRLAARADDGACLRDAARACASLWRYLETPTPGLWRDRQRPEGDFVEEPAPASSFYHLIGAIDELRRAASPDQRAAQARAPVDFAHAVAAQ
jgi:mannose-1-phosphate guanylyltransferase/mannose-6-phosphate isomerase